MTDPRPEVLIVGMGGIGVLTSLTLEKNDKVNVSVIIRNQDEEFNNNGFKIDSQSFGKIQWKPKNIFKSVDEAAASSKKFDYVVLCTKNLPDSAPLSHEIIKPVISENTTILLNQNGLGIELPILNHFPNNLVLSGIILSGSSKYGNNIRHVAIDRSQFGIFKANNIENHKILSIEQAEKKLQIYLDAYKREDNDITKDDDVDLNRWYKLTYNSVFNTVAAICDCDVTRIHINNGNSIFMKIINEIKLIAKSEGYILDDKRIDFIFHTSDGLFYQPSMQIDKYKNQLMEIEVIVGNPLKVAQKNNIETPHLSLIYDFLKIMQFNIKEKLGIIKLNQDDFKNVSSDDCPKVFNDIYN